ncbi:MAG: GAF domain-containing sensor histidine kinase [Dehalococcoidia bacterium]
MADRLAERAHEVTGAAALEFGRILPDASVVLLIVALTAAGVLGFSSWVFRAVRRAQQEGAQRARELAAINEASLAVSSDLDLGSVLQRVVDLSRSVTDARYGALALVDDDHRIVEFLTSGISLEERERIGALPEGRGLLGAVIRDGLALRVDRIADDPRSYGLPPNHPPMTSFIGLPILYEGRVAGDLYLTDKHGGEPFTEADENVLRTFSAHAAVAIENARLYQQVQDYVVMEERDRIGMDLHDGIIQSLYATGLMLENSLEDLKEAPAEVGPQLQRAIDHLNQTIRDIRNYILDLRPTVLAGTDLAGAVGGLLQELKANSLIEVQLDEEPGACRNLTEEQTNALFHLAQESLTNVRKHAGATHVTTKLAQRNGVFTMTVTDDGAGFDPAQPGAGQGLQNMRERASALGGSLRVASSPGHGATLTVELPLGAKGAR